MPKITLSGHVISHSFFGRKYLGRGWFCYGPRSLVQRLSYETAKSNMADAAPFADGATKETVVSLFACYGKVYAWDADDVFKIRSKYRIVASLIGSLPRKPRQNNAFSLPLLLSREEATLLLEKGFAKIYEMPKALPAPSTEEVEKFNELRRDSIMKQIEQFQRMQEEKRRELAEVIQEGRRRKRQKMETNTEQDLDNVSDEDREAEETKDWAQLRMICDESNDVKGNKEGKEGKKKRKRKCKKVADEEESLVTKKVKRKELNDEFAEDGVTEEERDWNQLNKNNCNENSDMNEKRNNKEMCHKNAGPQVTEANLSSANAEQEAENKLVEKKKTPNLSTSSERSIEEHKSYSELGTLIHIPTEMPRRMQSLPPAVWTYPKTDREKLRYRVFLDLWEKGYYLTSGVNFGGDFLAYPGDPMRYHSFYIVIVVPWGKRITPFEMISAGRLGATVKKTALLCSVNDDTEEVVYTSVKWSGIS